MGIDLGVFFGAISMNQYLFSNAGQGQEFDPGRPLIFMHVPKCGGTSVDASLRNALGMHDAKRFFGTVLHGDMPLETYQSWEHEALAHVALDAGSFAQESPLVIAHASYRELLDRHPDGQFITFLREPICRLISLRTFLMSFSDATVSHFGLHGMAILRARLSLQDFLRHPYFAATYDNVFTRMLLHGDSSIPAHGFIDAFLDEELLEKAFTVLAKFNGVFAIEDKAMPDRVSHFLGRSFHLSHDNESTDVPDHLRGDLNHQLTDAMNLLENHSRIDFRIWATVMGFPSAEEASGAQKDLIGRCVDRHARLLAPRSRDLA